MGWCRGRYSVWLLAHIYTHCDAADSTCKRTHLGEQPVGSDTFLVGSEVRPACHHLGLVELCFEPATHGSAARWSVTAPFEDVSDDNDEIEALVERAFRGHPELRGHWEVDDTVVWGWMKHRAGAETMARLLRRLLTR